ncbi:MAG: histidine phosphatase family protein [Candidatus Levyibacteriota bacterium]
MAKIFIFRHGQTTDNRDKRFSGWANPDLTPEGEEEARSIGEELKYEPVTKAYSSDLLRAIHTMQLVLEKYHPGIQIIEDPRIKERDYGELTGKNKDEIAKEFPKEYPLWHRSYDVAPPGGENIEMVEKRVLSFLHDVLPTLFKDDVVFISAHGNSLRPMRKYFEHMTNEEMCSFEHTPGKVYSYEV